MAVRAVLIVLALAVVGAFATPPYAGFGPHLVLPGNLGERLEIPGVLPADFGLEVLINTPGIVGQVGGIFTKGSVRSGGDGFSVVQANENDMELLVRAGSSEFTLTQSYFLNEWVRVSVFFSGTNVGLFINGVGTWADAGFDFDAAGASGDLIVANTDDNLNPFVGFLDDLRVHTASVLPDAKWVREHAFTEDHHGAAATFDFTDMEAVSSIPARGDAEISDIVVTGTVSYDLSALVPIIFIEGESWWSGSLPASPIPTETISNFRVSASASQAAVAGSNSMNNHFSVTAFYGASGADTFSYAVTNPQGEVSTQEVEVVFGTIVDTPPTLENPPTLDFVLNQPISVPVIQPESLDHVFGTNHGEPLVLDADSLTPPPFAEFHGAVTRKVPAVDFQGAYLVEYYGEGGEMAVAVFEFVIRSYQLSPMGPVEIGAYHSPDGSAFSKPQFSAVFEDALYVGGLEGPTDDLLRTFVLPYGGGDPMVGPTFELPAPMHVLAGASHFSLVAMVEASRPSWVVVLDVASNSIVGEFEGAANVRGVAVSYDLGVVCATYADATAGCFAIEGDGSMLFSYINQDGSVMNTPYINHDDNSVAFSSATATDSLHIETGERIAHTTHGSAPQAVVYNHNTMIFVVDGSVEIHAMDSDLNLWQTVALIASDVDIPHGSHVTTHLYANEQAGIMDVYVHDTDARQTTVYDIFIGYRGMATDGDHVRSWEVDLMATDFTQSTTLDVIFVIGFYEEEVASVDFDGFGWDIVVGSTFDVTATFFDQWGNVVETAPSNYDELRVDGSTLLDTTNRVSGVSYFSGISIDSIYDDTTFVLAGFYSDSFDVVPDDPADMTVTVPSSASAIGSFTVTVSVVDQYGNTVHNPPGTVAVSSSDADIGGSTTASVSSGTATIGPVSIEEAGTHSLDVSYSMFGLSHSTTITINPGSAVGFEIDYVSNLAAGSGPTVSVTVVDAKGNEVSSYAGSPMLEIINQATETTVETLSPSPATSFSDSFAAVETAGTYLVSVSDGSLEGTSNSFEVMPAALDSVSLTDTSSGGVLLIGEFIEITATLLDQFGNVLTHDSSTVITVTATVDTLSVGVGAGGNSIATASSGVGQLNVRMNQPIGGGDLVFTVGPSGTTSTIELSLESTPSAPLSFAIDTVGEESFDLTWSAPFEDGNSPLLAYEIWAVRGDDFDDASVSPLVMFPGSGDLSATFPLPPVDYFVLAIRALNLHGAGPWSNMVEDGTLILRDSGLQMDGLTPIFLHEGMHLSVVVGRRALDYSVSWSLAVDAADVSFPSPLTAVIAPFASGITGDDPFTIDAAVTVTLDNGVSYTNSLSQTVDAADFVVFGDQVGTISAPLVARYTATAPELLFYAWDPADIEDGGWPEEAVGVSFSRLVTLADGTEYENPISSFAFDYSFPMFGDRVGFAVIDIPNSQIIARVLLENGAVSPVVVVDTTPGEGVDEVTDSLGLSFENLGTAMFNAMSDGVAYNTLFDIFLADGRFSHLSNGVFTAVDVGDDSGATIESVLQNAFTQIHGVIASVGGTGLLTAAEAEIVLDAQASVLRRVALSGISEDTFLLMVEHVALVIDLVEVPSVGLLRRATAVLDQAMDMIQFIEAGEDAVVGAPGTTPSQVSVDTEYFLLITAAYINVLSSAAERMAPGSPPVCVAVARAEFCVQFGYEFAGMYALDTGARIWVPEGAATLTCSGACTGVPILTRTARLSLAIGTEQDPLSDVFDFGAMYFGESEGVFFNPPATISFPLTEMPAPGTPYAVRWIDDATGELRTDGISNVVVADGWVTFQTTHLTLFVLTTDWSVCASVDCGAYGVDCNACVADACCGFCRLAFACTKIVGGGPASGCAAFTTSECSATDSCDPFYGFP